MLVLEKSRWLGTGGYAEDESEETNNEGAQTGKHPR
jgi:hypothetical protein